MSVRKIRCNQSQTRACPKRSVLGVSCTTHDASCSPTVELLSSLDESQQNMSLRDFMGALERSDRCDCRCSCVAEDNAADCSTSQRRRWAWMNHRRKEPRPIQTGGPCQESLAWWVHGPARGKRSRCGLTVAVRDRLSRCPSAVVANPGRRRHKMKALTGQGF